MDNCLALNSFCGWFHFISDLPQIWGRPEKASITVGSHFQRTLGGLALLRKLFCDPEKGWWWWYRSVSFAMTIGQVEGHTLCHTGKENEKTCKMANYGDFSFHSTSQHLPNNIFWPLSTKTSGRNIWFENSNFVTSFSFKPRWFERWLINQIFENIFSYESRATQMSFLIFIHRLFLLLWNYMMF